MTGPVQYSRVGAIGLIELDNPPVNATSQAVRAGLAHSIAQGAQDDGVFALVVTALGRTFIAGADIREFGKPLAEPLLPDVINQIEACEKPVVMALHGTVLGGGLEVAMGGHYRIASPKTRFGLPEVTLGLLPGAGGTQRLPRLVPMDRAIELIASGSMIGARQALDLGLVDRLSEEPLSEAAISFAHELIKEGRGVRPVRSLPCSQASDAMFETARSFWAKKKRGQLAPQKAIDAVEGAWRLDFEEGLRAERSLFLELMETDQRASLIHAFMSERKTSKLPELKGVDPRHLSQIGVIGGGTMGAGIAVSSLLAGLSVVLIERDGEAVARAQETVFGLLEGALKRGKLSQDRLEQIHAGDFQAGDDYGALKEADLVIEAVFESMEVKKDVFTKLDQVCKDGAVLASNTSYLDLNEIADMTKRPQDVIGLHFFSPAHVMKLLEVVVGDKTSPEVVSTGFALAKTLRKISVRAGVCDGFIGNRILSHYRKALEGAVLAGASPYQVDRALVGFGLAMGPFAVSDLAGLDIGWASRKRLAPTRDPRESYAEFSDRLCEIDRFGRKSGRGFYIYEDGQAVEDREVEAIVASERLAKGITPRALSDEEIVARFMAAMVNEASRVVEEGIALRPLDVDVVLLNGYGFPRWRGGPMHYADTVGLDRILADVEAFGAEDPFLWQASSLLKRLVKEQKRFGDLND